MARREILVSLDDDLVRRIDEAAPARGRSAWIGAACEAALASDGAPQAGNGEAAIWQATTAAVLEAWRLERGNGQHDGG
jgi:metal-responsive CopG/Arc/MetJ family transcriptional regulator